MKEKHALNTLSKIIKKESFESFMLNYEEKKEYYKKIGFNLPAFMSILNRSKNKEDLKLRVKRDDYYSFLLTLIRKKEVDYLKNKLSKRVLIKDLREFTNKGVVKKTLNKILEKMDAETAFKKIKATLRNQKNIKNELQLALSLSETFDLFDNSYNSLNRLIKIHNEKNEDEVELVHLKDSIYYIKTTNRSSLLLHKICSKEYCVSYSAINFDTNLDNLTHSYLFFDFCAPNSNLISYFLVLDKLDCSSFSIYNYHNMKHEIKLADVMTMKGKENYLTDEDSDEESSQGRYFAYVLSNLINTCVRKEIFTKYFSKEKNNKKTDNNYLALGSLVVKVIYYGDKQAAKKIIKLYKNKKTNLLKIEAQRSILYMTQRLSGCELCLESRIKLTKNEALNLLLKHVSEEVAEICTSETLYAFFEMSLRSIIQECGYYACREKEIIKNTYLKNKLKKESLFSETISNSEAIEKRYKTGTFSKRNIKEIQENVYLQNILFDYLNALTVDQNANKDYFVDIISFLITLPIDLIDKYFASKKLDFYMEIDVSMFVFFAKKIKNKMGEKSFLNVEAFIKEGEAYFQIDLKNTVGLMSQNMQELLNEILVKEGYEYNFEPNFIDVGYGSKKLKLEESEEVEFVCFDFNDNDIDYDDDDYNDDYESYDDEEEDDLDLKIS